jgi:hypothetical protein
MLLQNKSILFQRAIYPPEDFKMVKKYGLNVLVTIDDSLKSYLKKLLTQVEGIIFHVFLTFHIFY